MIVINFSNVEYELCRMSAAEYYYSATPSGRDAAETHRLPLLTERQLPRYRIYVEEALRVGVAGVRAWLTYITWSPEGVTFFAPADITVELISFAANKVWHRILQAAGERELAEAARETADTILSGIIARMLTAG